MKYLFLSAEVYCGTYYKYNIGSLFGKWINLSDFNDAEELDKALRELHKDEDDPEFMFQDTSDFPDFICDGEPSWSEVVRCMEFANYLWDDQWNEDIIIAASEVEDFSNMSPEEIEGWLEEHFEGEKNPYFVAEEYLIENSVPDVVREFVDYDELGERLLEDFTESDGYYFNV